MTQPGQLMIPSAADAPTLTLAACNLLASEFPQALTPDQQHDLGVRAVDAVMIIWNEIAARIAAGVLITPTE